MVEATKELILEVARRRFADHGYVGHEPQRDRRRGRHPPPEPAAPLPVEGRAATARCCSTRSPTGSTLVDNAIEGPREGWPQVERMLRAAFTFFEEHPEFVRLVRWEALEGGPILRDELAVLLRPLFDRGAAFLEREMDAGRLRRYDARQLLLTGYGAVLSYLSDAPLMSGPARHRSALARGARRAARARHRRAAHAVALDRTVLPVDELAASARAATRRRTRRARRSATRP